MVAVNLVESLSILGGLALLAIALILILRPLTIHLTVHHNRDDDDQGDEPDDRPHPFG